MNIGQKGYVPVEYLKMDNTPMLKIWDISSVYDKPQDWIKFSILKISESDFHLQINGKNLLDVISKVNCGDLKEKSLAFNGAYRDDKYSYPQTYNIRKLHNMALMSQEYALAEIARREIERIDGKDKGRYT